jgi:hypothetical protein
MEIGPHTHPVASNLANGVAKELKRMLNSSGYLGGPITTEPSLAESSIRTCVYRIPQIEDFLTEEGFEVLTQSIQRIIMAKNREMGVTILVKIWGDGDSKQVSTQFNLNSDEVLHLMTPSQFRKVIGLYMQRLSTPFEPGLLALRKEALTAYGWHAYLSSSSRQESLIDAAADFDAQYILTVLKFQFNLMNRHPTNYQYSDNVNDDVQWVEENLSFGSRRYRERKTVTDFFKNQFRILIGKSGESQDSINHILEKSRLYIVTLE